MQTNNRKKLPTLPRQEEIIYNTAINNIQFIKKQEWVFTSSALTAYGALVAAAKYLPLSNAMALFLYAAIFASWIFNALILFGMKDSLQLARQDVDRILKNYFNEKTPPRNCFDTCGLFFCLLVILFVGSIISAYAIYQASSPHLLCP
jgi:hypothetical protein